MSVTIEQFAASLIKTLMPSPCHPTGYVLAGNLAAALQQALIPPEEQGQQPYPLMLYRGSWESEEMRTVASAEEQEAAMANGWRLTAAPRPVGYPKNMVELARGEYRRVLIRNPNEEKIFQQVTNAGDWVEDSAHALAGRPIGLDQLVQERKEALKAMVDADLLETEIPAGS